MDTTTSVDIAAMESEPVMDIMSRCELLQFLLTLTARLNGSDFNRSNRSKFL
jgi:hypothetical protein